MIENLNVRGLKYFQEISKIPRGSGNRKAISDYLTKFGQDLGLKTIQDEELNVIIYKDGTGSSKDAIILQGHFDMVCEKNSDSNHDFLNDEIKLIVDGDFIHADNTTLGADNGVAIAYAMEILASNDLKHPPLEVVFTADEETGMFGAHGLDMSLFSAKKMINIDNEEEGVFVVSCAGGQRVDVEVPVKFSSNNSDFVAYELKISGLLGGHSGIDCDKERANSNKLMARVALEISKKTDFNIISINGGAQDNAIPREAFLKVLVPKNFDINEVAKNMLETFKNEFSATDKNINLEVLKTEFSNSLSREDSMKVINSILLMPSGIMNMNKAINIPETSTNLGVVITESDKVILRSALRSAKASRLGLMADTMVSLAHRVEGVCNVNKPYPGWEYKDESDLRDLFVSTYKELTGKDAVVEGIHAGLECGIFASKIDGIDIIAVGPDIFDPHTPKEKFDYKSMQRTFDLIKVVLEKLS